MRISVITPSFNQGAFIKQTIESVLQQKYPDLEYIIIDGGSNDNTVELIKGFGDRISFWVSEKDKGQCDAVNKGLRRATGEIIGWINSDDFYREGAFAEAAAYFAAHPEIDVVFGDYCFVNGVGRVLKCRREIVADLETYLWAGLCPHANCAGFFRRRFFERVGYLREDLHYLMDYELYLRGLVCGRLFGHVSSVWGNYRLHDEAKTTEHGSLAYTMELEAIRSHYLKRMGYDSSQSIVTLRSLAARYRRRIRKLLYGCYNISLC